MRRWFRCMVMILVDYVVGAILNIAYLVVSGATTAVWNKIPKRARVRCGQ